MLVVVLLSFFLFLSAPRPTTALGISDYVDGQCIVSAVPPGRPMGLEFCHWYNSKACCIPQLDMDTMNIFGNAVNLGLSCSISKHQIKVTYNPLREWYCMACDPDEPRYRYKIQKGDAHLAGGQQAGNPNATSTATAWRVCKSFLQGTDGKSGVWGVDGTMYDQCGVMTENPCDGGKQVVWDPKLNNGDGAIFTTTVPVVAGWDPFMCGDNLIVPSKEYRNDAYPPSSLLLAIKPPGFQDIGFSFVIVDDSKPDFVYDSTPCFKGLQGAASRVGGVPTVALILMMAVSFCV